MNTEPKHRDIEDAATSYANEHGSPVAAYAHELCKAFTAGAEYVSQEVAELRKENEKLTAWNEDKKRQIAELRDSLDFHLLINLKYENEKQAETIKGYKETLEHLLTDFKSTNVFHCNQGYINLIEATLSSKKA